MSKEYIERETAIAETRKPRLTDAELRRRLALIPAADVVEVQHGDWEEVEIKDSEEIVIPPSLVTMRCNKCNHYHTTIFFRYGPPTDGMNYCPNCGAKMDGGADDGT